MSDYTLNDLYDEVRKWSDATFGPPSVRGPRGPLEHLLKELDEIEREPGDVVEHADALILWCDAVRRGDCEAAVEWSDYVRVCCADTLAACVARVRHRVIGVMGWRDRNGFFLILSTLGDLRAVCGHTADAVLLAAREKMVINRARKWPVPTANGIVEQIQEAS